MKKLKKQVHVYLHVSTIKQIDKFANDFAFSRSTALGFIVREYLRDKPRYNEDSLD